MLCGTTASGGFLVVSGERVLNCYNFTTRHCLLHWLKAPERIAFKYAVLLYKCLHGSAPAYPTDELCQVADVEARQRLRASSFIFVTDCQPHPTVYHR